MDYVMFVFAYDIHLVTSPCCSPSSFSLSFIYLFGLCMQTVGHVWWFLMHLFRWRSALKHSFSLDTKKRIQLIFPATTTRAQDRWALQDREHKRRLSHRNACYIRILYPHPLDLRCCAKRNIVLGRWSTYAEQFWCIQFSHRLSWCVRICVWIGGH